MKQKSIGEGVGGIDRKTDQGKQRKRSDKIAGDSQRDSKQSNKSRPKMEERVNEQKT